MKTYYYKATAYLQREKLTTVFFEFTADNSLQKNLVFLKVNLEIIQHFKARLTMEELNEMQVRFTQYNNESELFADSVLESANPNVETIKKY